MGPTQNIEPRADWLTLFNLIARLAPWQRILWLEKCCVLASRGGPPTRVTDCRGELDECWQVYRVICGQGQLTVDSAGRLASKLVGS